MGRARKAKKRERGRDLQKINRVSCFKGGGTHRHSIVQANYQRQIITADGSSVERRAAEQMMKCERRGGGVKLTLVLKPHTPDVDFNEDNSLSLALTAAMTPTGLT